MQNLEQVCGEWYRNIFCRELISAIAVVVVVARVLICATSPFITDTRMSPNLITIEESEGSHKLLDNTVFVVRCIRCGFVATRLHYVRMPPNTTRAETVLKMIWVPFSSVSKLLIFQFALELLRFRQFANGLVEVILVDGISASLDSEQTPEHDN
jgi:hypothetical protein